MVSSESSSMKCSFEKALDLTGFGKYNINMLAACCLLILTMYMDIFGVSVLLPAVACDLSLDTYQQGILSAVPLIGVILSSYIWGLAADTIGRRKTLLIAMPIGFLLGVAASMAPNYEALAVLKFCSVMFTSAANAAAFVLMAESVPRKNRNRFMFIMASCTMFVMFIISCCAIPILKLNFHLPIPCLSMEYRPWRLVLQIVALPGAVGAFLLLFLRESPKFLLSKSKHDKALSVLQEIFQSNTGNKKDAYSVMCVWLDDQLQASSETSLLKKIWNQTVPLFKPPLLKNSVILYYLMLCAYMTSTGYSLWVPTLANAFFTGADTTGLTFCQVASQSATSNRTTFEDCDHAIQPMTFYAVMCYSLVATILTILLSFVVGTLGKKTITLTVFVISSICGTLLLFVKIPLLSLALLFMFLYVAQILGNVNAYLVDLNPTHLRGMATCLSVVVARGSGFFGAQLIGILLENYCVPTLSGYIILVASGFVVATFLPPDTKHKDIDNQQIVEDGDSCKEAST